MPDYASLLRDHVTLKYRSLDRIFLQAYMPRLQCTGQVCTFLRWQRGFRIPSSAAFGQIGRGFVRSIERFALQHKIPLVRFQKGQCKEKVAAPYLQQAAREGRDRVVLIGTAQEKTSAWRSWKAKGHEHAAHPHMEWGRQMAFVNHYYFYLWDSEWGPTFWKTNAYAPYPIWLWLNGHEWAKRQLEKAGIGYQALDNGFRSCEDPEALQSTCDRLGCGEVQRFFWRWFWRLPSPWTREDLNAGYVYQLAFRQLEVSETCVFDRPQSGRMFFEGVIRDHLDVGRPQKVVLWFDRRLTKRTPGTFRTRALTRGVDPVLSCYYKSTRIKQYFKEGRALRTETVIGDSKDFGVGRRVCRQTWNALRAVGEDANRRLCDAQASDARPAPDVHTVQQVCRPTTTPEGLPAAALRFGDPRVMALLASLVSFCHCFTGFTNPQLVQQIRTLLGRPYTSRQATYDLRRLQRKGLIRRLGRSRRYRTTAEGRRIAVLFTKAYGRVLAPGVVALDLKLPQELARGCPLARAWRRFDKTLNQYLDKQLLAA